jgi:Glycosyl transferases group 1
MGTHERNIGADGTASVAAVLPASYTLIVPHQRATSGGVYVIEQLARHLADSAEVTLAVRRGPTRPIEGVQVLDAPRLSAEELPDADVVIGGLAQPDPERVLDLPPGKGAPLFLFQGYGTPGNSLVTGMLRRRPRVLAVSRFLAKRASEHGCEVELVRPGLDRTTFAAGEPCARRAPVVALMTHALDWKATEDGLSALAHVRATVPELEVRLFGADAPEVNLCAPEVNLCAAHLGKLSHPHVAELLREVSVFVCPSLEEGLGLPGIEALACGAALASTDTQGGRDYAIDEQTALVTPPHRPDLLAESIVRLLREPRLRGRLAEQGREHVLATYSSWPQATEHFAQAVRRLLHGASTPMARSNTSASRA